MLPESTSPVLGVVDLCDEGSYGWPDNFMSCHGVDPVQLKAPAESNVSKYKKSRKCLLLTVPTNLPQGKQTF